MKYSFFTLCIFLLVGTTRVAAQTVQFKKGAFDALKGQSEVNVEFVYETSVGEFDKEEDYLSEKVIEKNEEEAGLGDAWKARWIADRNERFEPKFLELFNKYGQKSGLTANENRSAKYTFIVKTIHTEPGWNVAVVRRNAHVNIELTFVETSDRDNILNRSFMKEIPGRGGAGFDFDVGYRLQEAYGLAGKVLGRYLAKNVLK